MRSNSDATTFPSRPVQAPARAAGASGDAGWTINRLAAKLAKIDQGQIDVRLPGGKTLRFGEEHRDRGYGHIEIESPRVLRRVLLDGATGFAEAYMAGEWTTPDLAATLEVLCRNAAARDQIEGTPLAVLLRRLMHWRRANTRRGSARNIAYHYDLGNDFYSLWLDETMTYSAALFSDPGQPLAAAQRAKYRRLADHIGLEPGKHVLEIGCGWGGFAEIAARDYGARVTAITLSREQEAFARARMERAGLANRVEIRYQDYRDLKGQYDAIASIEMFEAVGEEHWPGFFRIARECLKPGGRAGLQIITIAEDRFEAYKRSPDFIQTYIFPGGMLPTRRALEALGAGAGLGLRDAFTFGPDYARTLELWQADFLANWQKIERLGFDSRFRRMWEYYLAYCRAGFTTGLIDVGHYVLERPVA